jgi:hypothetical protein
MGTRAKKNAVAQCIRERSNWSKLTDQHKLDHAKFSPDQFKEDIPVASPKLHTLIQTIRRLDEEDTKTYGHTFKHFIYSDLKTAYGAKLIASALSAFGFHHAYGLGKSARGRAFVLNPPKKDAFATLTTAQFFQKPLGINFRKEILKRFNTRPQNIYGEQLRLVILDSGLREGVDLFDVKYVHLFEPILTQGDQKQAVGRATRFCGQKGLTFDNGWPLHVYRYDTSGLFELFMEYSNLDLKKMALAQTLEDVVIDAAVDRTLTTAFGYRNRALQSGGGSMYKPSAQELRAKRVADARRAFAEAARVPFIQKRQAEKEAELKRQRELLAKLAEKQRKAAESAERHRLSAEERARAESAERKAKSAERHAKSAEARRIAEEKRRAEESAERHRLSAEERARAEAKRRAEESAERHRLSAEERARAEAKRRAEESAERHRLSAEARRIAEEKRLREESAERHRLSAEARRIAESAERHAKSAEARRIAEEKRLREESAERHRLSAERSKIPPAAPTTVEKMDAYVQRHFADYSWPPMTLENGCVPRDAAAQDLTPPFEFSPTQQFIRHYLTPMSPYHGLLAFHSVGTGKTCLAIATATTHFEPQGWTILYITKTTLKGDVWKNMFDQVCSLVLQGKPIPTDKAARMRLLSKSWSQIQPLSYRQFSNMLRGKNALAGKLRSINGTKDPLQKTLVIIDEAHKLFVSDLPPSEKCDLAAVQKAFQHSYETSGADAVKLLLMTGTPYTDDPLDMIKLLNLFLEPPRQLPEDFAAFAAAYLDTDGHFTPTGRVAFMNHIAGLVSYLNRENDRRTFSYPIFYDLSVAPAPIEYAELQAAYDAHAAKLADLETTFATLESGEAVASAQKQLDDCLKTLPEVKRCKKDTETKFEPMLRAAATDCDMETYRRTFQEKQHALLKCLEMGPDDCTPQKERVAALQGSKKTLLKTAEAELKAARKHHRELKKTLQDHIDRDRSQTGAIRGCLDK